MEQFRKSHVRLTKAGRRPDGGQIYLSNMENLVRRIKENPPAETLRGTTVAGAAATGTRGPGRQGPGRQGPGRQDPGRQDPGRQDPGHQDPGHQDPGRHAAPIDAALKKPPFERQAPTLEEPTLEDKVRFLSRALSSGAAEPERRETRMSWVFLTRDEAVKLKKPVQLPYLDFATPGRREKACRAELALNRRLAPDVYKAVVPLVRSAQGLVIGRSDGGDAGGDVVDWLVVMRRLDPNATLERTIAAGRPTATQLDRLAATLIAFYRRAAPVLISAETHMRGWHASLALTARVLFDRRLELPGGLVREVHRVQRRFLAARSGLIAGRVRDRRIVDGHGDLRPEHIWLTDPVRIIDGQEFNARLRAVDPCDEIAFLCLECDRLGCPAAAAHIRRRAAHRLPGGLPDELFTFYRCHRAGLRARLAATHFLDPGPHPPEKWLGLARTYLRLAADDARRLGQFM